MAVPHSIVFMAHSKIVLITFFQELNLPCALSIHKAGLPDKLVQLLKVARDSLLAPAPPAPDSAVSTDKETKQSPK